MWTAVLIVLVIILASIVVSVAYYSRKYVFEDESELEVEAISYIREYQAKLTGSNRFPCGVEDLEKAFPEYRQKEIGKVWKKLVDRGYIKQDPLDQVWCIK